MFSGKDSVIFDTGGRKIEIDGPEKAGSVPADAADEAAICLMKIYMKNMERAGSPGLS